MSSVKKSPSVLRNQNLLRNGWTVLMKSLWLFDISACFRSTKNHQDCGVQGQWFMHYTALVLKYLIHPWHIYLHRSFENNKLFYQSQQDWRNFSATLPAKATWIAKLSTVFKIGNETEMKTLQSLEANIHTLDMSTYKYSQRF